MVDALASGASVPRDVEVQVLSRAPNLVTGTPIYKIERLLYLYEISSLLFWVQVLFGGSINVKALT